MLLDHRLADAELVNAVANVSMAWVTAAVLVDVCTEGFMVRVRVVGAGAESYSPCSERMSRAAAVASGECLDDDGFGMLRIRFCDLGVSDCWAANFL